jgi:hypothetical protein
MKCREAKVVSQPEQAPPPSTVPGSSVGSTTTPQAPRHLLFSIGLVKELLAEEKVESTMNQPVSDAPSSFTGGPLTFEKANDHGDFIQIQKFPKRGRR